MDNSLEKDNTMKGLRMHNYLVKLLLINCAIILPVLCADCVENASIKKALNIPYKVLADIGPRQQMEDYHAEHHESIHGADYSFFGVYDGHYGDYAAQTAACGDQDQNIPALHEILFSQLKAKYVINEHLFTKVFRTMDSHLYERAYRISLQQPQWLPYNQAAAPYAFGTTALVALIEKTRLLLAWAGDSRAVVVGHDGQILYSTQDHNPERPDEEQRVKNAGGSIKYTGGCKRLDGKLSMTRALGNYPLKTFAREALTAKPEVHELSLKSAAYMILASDGLWHMVSNETAASIVHNELKDQKPGDQLEQVTQKLKERAFWQRKTDNITITVADLRPLCHALQDGPDEQQDLPMHNPLM